MPEPVVYSTDLSLIQKNISQQIKDLALESGFDFTGFSKTQRLNDEEERLRSWLNSGFHGRMQYLENHFNKRLDPAELLPGARTVISFLYNYFPQKEIANDTYKIARYAYGKDYHKVIKKKLKKFMKEVEILIPGIKYRIFVDSAPVMERQWAAAAGLGWIGKNTLLINKNKGSYFFIADVLIDAELDYDHAIADFCGSCTKCLDACPTNAFPQAYVLDASKCISYATIELKDQIIPSDFKGKMKDYIFGCDICQEVCPWNRFSTSHKESEFLPKSELLTMQKKDWEELEEKNYDKLFESSAVKRAKFSGLKRNIAFVKAD